MICSVPKFYFEFKIQNYGFVLVLVVVLELVLVVEVPPVLVLVVELLLLVLVVEVPVELAFDGEDDGVMVEAGVAVEAGVDAFALLVFAFAFEFVLAAGSQASPRAPKAKTAERAKVFFIFLYSPVFSKINFYYLPTVFFFKQSSPKILNILEHLDNINT